MNEIENAIEDFRQLKNINKEFERQVFDDAAIKHIDMAIVALEKQLTNGWIPVSERLPNEKECNRFDNIRHPNYRKFLCTIKIADYESQTRELYLSKLFGWKYGPEDYNEYVIAWQPLPEPYKEVIK